MADKEIPEKSFIDDKNTIDIPRVIAYQGKDKVISSIDMGIFIQKQLELEPTVFKFFTGIEELDDKYKGFRSGSVNVISGIPGHGKSSFCRTLTISAYLQNIKSQWFSFEEPNEEFFEKFPKDIPEFYLPQEMKDNDIKWITERVIEGIIKYNVKVIFIDHLHYLLPFGSTNREAIIGDIMRYLKLKLARRFDIVVFLIAHLKKNIEEDSKGGKVRIAGLSDIRDSSFIGGEADTVTMVTRVDVENCYDTRTELTVRKNRRYGIYGSVKCLYKNHTLLECDDEGKIKEKGVPFNKAVQMALPERKDLYS